MYKLSVIIPIYNVEQYLRKCLDSVCNQTLEDIEIICINDCSPDNSLEILKEYQKNDNRIKIIDFKENRGVAAARNEAIKIAKGEYIGFVDSDDWIDLDFYEKLYKKASYTSSQIAIANAKKIVNNKYGNFVTDIENIKKNVIIKNVSKSQENMSDKLDKIFLNKWLAFPIFVGIMFCVYYLSVGVVGRFTVDFISQAIQNLSQNVRGVLENLNVSEWLNSLIVDGIIAGVGSVLGFIPQLIILFTCISVLETTGYMSRIALLLDKIFRKIGLSGKSLIPFIIGSGCSVPGIMGTRIIENSNEREMTAILTPFIPCSAKLPVIAMFSGYFFDKYSGLMSASLYLLAITIIILSAMVMKKWIYKNNNSTYISELPEYKLPSTKYVFKDVFDKTISFIKRAGSVILMCSIIIWFLLSFSFKLEYGVNVENSILSWIGRAISWMIYPMLGVNSWGATVSAIQGLVAKEQVISSMTVIAGLSEEASGQIFKTGIFSFFTPASAYAFMVFNLFSAPCFGAIGALEKELGTFEKMLKVVVFQIVFAWSLAVLIYQVGSRIENGSFNIWNFIILGIIGVIFFMLLTSKQKCSQCEGCGKCIDMK